MIASRLRAYPVFLLTTWIAFTGHDPTALGQGELYPDIFPFVAVDAPSNLQTLQNWQLSGNLLRFDSLFANQGDGLFEIRQGAPAGPDRYELLQRVYRNTDFGPEFTDYGIGTAPTPGSAGTPNPNDFNVIWFEDFSRFTLHEAPVVDGNLTVGAEVAGDTKTSWRLSANRGPLPDYPSDTPRYTGSDQSIEQRISVGWADLYTAGSRDQYIDITGVTFGPRYWLRQTVDPANRIMETDETNNSFEILIDLNNPGEAITFAGEFVRPGDPAPPIPGDLNLDGEITLADWQHFKSGANTNLSGLSPQEAYLLGDLDSDGEHTISDVVLFRELYDSANGIGAFASAQQVPEPSSWLLCGAFCAGLVFWAPRFMRKAAYATLIIAVATISLLDPSVVRAAVVFQENFDSLSLGPNVDEGLNASNVWTDTPPSGWQIDSSGVPGGGVTEWRGWSFADPDWWTSTAGDQRRSEFTKGSGVVAVADPDEWDDLPNSPGTYNTFLATPEIALPALSPNSLQLQFDSSWRPEDFQDANLSVSFDGGAPIELLNWTSQPGPNFKADATNETIVLPLNNPVSANSMQLVFGMVNAGNDWWWAIDNLEVLTPTTLQVNTDTGEMTILGADGIAGYEITGPAGSLDPVGWQAGNLDAQDIGAATPLVGDLNYDNAVNSGDRSTWQAAYGGTNGGDVDGDGDADGQDFLSLQQEDGTSLALGSSWETLVASEDQLLEFYLLGDSTLEAQSIGYGYNTTAGSNELSFIYSNVDGDEFVGAVTYVSNSQAAAASVPEASSVSLLILATTLLAPARLRGSR